MGDLMELTTWSNTRLTFYKITSSGLWFEVKARGPALIGLSKNITREERQNIDYLICLGNGGTDIRQPSHAPYTCVNFATPGILNRNEFKRFWLIWDKGFLKLGHSGNKEPIIEHKIDSTNLDYITFANFKDSCHPIYWRFELPPLMQKPKLKPILNGRPEWVQAVDQLPDGIFIGGYENEILYVIRAPHMRSLTPGKFVPSEGFGYVPWGGRANAKNEFEVLCGFDLIWVHTVEDKIPVGAVPAGYSEGGHETLYVGRIMHDGHLIPGKVQPSHKVCYIAYEEREIASKEYEILITPSFNSKFANEYFIPNELFQFQINE